MTKRGRKPGVKNGALKKHKGAKVRGLRMKHYTKACASNGGFASGYADQFGRLMEFFVNDKDSVDFRPTGLSIRANH